VQIIALFTRSEFVEARDTFEKKKKINK